MTTRTKRVYVFLDPGNLMATKESYAAKSLLVGKHGFTFDDVYRRDLPFEKNGKILIETELITYTTTKKK